MMTTAIFCVVVFHPCHVMSCHFAKKQFMHSSINFTVQVPVNVFVTIIASHIIINGVIDS